MKVETILQAKGAQVFTVQPDVKISEAISVLNENNIGAVLVVDKAGGIVGILSERDIVRRLGSDGVAILSSNVSSCMTENPYNCSCADNINDILQTMTKRRIRHMPVIKDDKIVGVVSIGDVVKSKIDETEQEAADLRNYIAT